MAVADDPPGTGGVLERNTQTKVLTPENAANIIIKHTCGCNSYADQMAPPVRNREILCGFILSGFFSMQTLSKDIEYYGSIDALKGIAILLVMTAHLPAAIILQPNPPIGQYGVQLFFIVSGLSIFASYAKREVIDEQRTVQFFFIRRFFRIAPLFYLSLIFYIWYSPLPLDWWNYYILLSIALFVNSFWPSAINYLPPGGWAVAIEMVFYAIVPWLFKRICNLRSALVLTVISVGLCLVQFNAVRLILENLYGRYQLYDLINNVRGWYGYFWFPNHFFSFTLGIILYHILVKEPDKIYLISKYKKAFLILLLLVFATAIFTDRMHQEFIPMHLLYSLVLFLFSIWIFISRSRFFVNKFTVLLGKLSFNLYLTHFAIQNYIAYSFVEYNIFIKLPYARPLYLLACFLCSLLVSYITHIIIEQPGIRVGRMLINMLRMKRTRLNAIVS